MHNRRAFSIQKPTQRMTTQFIDRMKLHWKLPCTGPLIEGWSQLEQAVEAASNEERWQVLPLPTGTGKTEALICLLATPALREHPGALVVTKFKSEADRLVSDVNRSAGKMIALAVHSDAKAASFEMATSPVLVITHAAYAAALREALSADVPARLDLYHQYHQIDRKWLIVDEAFDWTDTYEVDVDELAAASGALAGTLPDEATEVLKPLQTFAQSIIAEQNADQGDKLPSADQSQLLQDIDLTYLRLAIRSLPKKDTELWRNAELIRRRVRHDDDVQPTTFKKQYLTLLDALQAIQRIGDCWVSRRGTRTRIHSSRSLLDTKRKCGVILDATAGIDTNYDLLADHVAVSTRPHGIRAYGNVTTSVSRSHCVGKEHVVKHASVEWPMIAKQLSSDIAVESRALVITHKDAAPIVRQYGLKCKKFDVTHWGNLDGKNDWKDFDTVVVYGLPYLDDIAPTNAFLAHVGLRSNDWFQRGVQYGRHAEIKSAIKSGFIAKSVVQGINRARCRTISDHDGGCKTTNVFLLLPAGGTGDAVLSSIRQEMPGVQMREWRAMAVAPRGLVGNERRLLAMLRKSELGNYSKSEIIAQLPMKTRTFERMSSRLQKQNSTLLRELTAIGVKYDCSIGRGKEACFIKG